MRKILTLLFFVNILLSINAQDLNRICGQDELVKYFRSINPTYDEQVNDLFKEMYNNRIASPNVIDDTIYTVRVVVHVVYLKDDNIQNIPDDIIYSQIDALNRDYNLQNSDTINLRPIFNRFKGNPRIKFELATIDPYGNPTNGIDRVAGKAPSIPPATAIDTLIGSTDDWFKKGFNVRNVNGSKDTTIGARSWNNKKYLNIWVTDLNLFRDLSQGTLGGFAFAPPGLSNWPLGIGYPSDTADGLSIDFRFFGQNNYYAQANPRFLNIAGKGRTTVHELGHFLGLRHTWGDYGNVFNSDCNNLILAALFFNDGIDDTPVCKKPFSSSIGGYRCDTAVNSCTIPYQNIDYPDLFENYMDYSGDQCYNMFTKQQVDFIRRVLRTRRAGLIIRKEFNIPTAINNLKLRETGISFYPNPATNNITVSVEKPLKSSISVNLIDITGKIVSSQLLPNNIMNHSLDVSSLANGIYMIQFSNQEFTAIDKFVKE